jgi:GH25 family lysozyme M1 (1,4-beta-N-acetylmuramidase)
MRADVVDMYHGDAVTDFKRVKAAGVIGIIHKATQGSGMTDSAYAGRRKMAIDAGLLWGAYHFNTGENVATQVQHFVDAAKPDAHTLMALDFEDNRASNMTVDQAKDFLKRLKAAGIPRPVIYSGNRAKDTLGNRVDAELGGYRLWLAQYGPVAHLPPSWKAYWLWQFTGDGIGSPPHAVDGISTRGIDINQYNGAPANLASDWATAGAPTAAPDPVYSQPDGTPLK